MVAIIGWSVAFMCVMAVILYEARAQKKGKNFFYKTGKTWANVSDMKG